MFDRNSAVLDVSNQSYNCRWSRFGNVVVFAGRFMLSAVIPRLTWTTVGTLPYGANVNSQVCFGGMYNDASGVAHQFEVTINANKTLQFRMNEQVPASTVLMVNFAYICG